MGGGSSLHVVNVAVALAYPIKQRPWHLIYSGSTMGSTDAVGSRPDRDVASNQQIMEHSYSEHSAHDELPSDRRSHEQVVSVFGHRCS